MCISLGANQATALFDAVKQLIHTSKEGVGQVVRVARGQQNKLQIQAKLHPRQVPASWAAVSNNITGQC